MSVKHWSEDYIGEKVLVLDSGSVAYGDIGRVIDVSVINTALWYHVEFENHYQEWFQAELCALQ